MELSRVYEVAADLVARHGHTQGALYDGNGRICTYEAITRAVGMGGRGIAYEIDSPAVRYFESYVRSNVCTWNNKPLRTQQQVVDALRAVAQARREIEVAERYVAELVPA